MCAFCIFPWHGGIQDPRRTDKVSDEHTFLSHRCRCHGTLSGQRFFCNAPVPPDIVDQERSRHHVGAKRVVCDIIRAVIDGVLTTSGMDCTVLPQ